MTLRTKIYILIESMYRFCRDEHSRTINVISFFKDIIEKDKELLEFFEKCEEGSSDPRDNNIFDVGEWPDMSKLTDDDKNENIMMRIDICEKDFPKLLSYYEQYSELF